MRVEGERLYTQASGQLQRMRITEALRLLERAEQAHYDPNTCAAGRWLRKTRTIRTKSAILFLQFARWLV
jgi:hypothetical protein